MKKSANTLLAAIVAPATFLITYFIASLIVSFIASIPIIGTLILKIFVIDGSSSSWLVCLLSLGVSWFFVSLFQESTRLNSGMVAGFIAAGVTMFALGIILIIGGIAAAQSFWSILNYLAVAAFGVLLIMAGSSERHS